MEAVVKVLSVTKLGKKFKKTFPTTSTFNQGDFSIGLNGCSI